MHAIGDLLMSTPAIRELKRAYPECSITVLVGRWSAHVLKNNPYVDEIIDFDDAIFFKRKIFEIVSLLMKLRRKKFDTVFIFHPSLQIHLFAFLTGIPRRYGLRRDGRSLFLDGYIDENGSNDYYYPQNFLRLLTCAGIENQNASIEFHCTEDEKTRVLQTLSRNGIVDRDTFLVIAAGGAQNPKEAIHARRWPKEYFVHLINLIKEKYPDIKFVLTGAKGDIDVNKYIESQIHGTINMTGATSLSELAYLVKLSKAVICNDSSILHIAVSQNTPVACFFGPTSVKKYVPLPQSLYCIQSAIDCSPCCHYAIFKGCEKNYECMKLIKPEMVFEKVTQILSK